MANSRNKIALIHDKTCTGGSALFADRFAGGQSISSAKRRKLGMGKPDCTSLI